jgi:hypothetical protein
MIGITCGFCGQTTDFGLATVNLPPDHFQCWHCGRVVRRVHGQPKVLPNGFIIPGEIKIQEVARA